MFFEILLAVGIIFIVDFLFMRYRISWVYKECKKILDIKPISEALEEYEKLPSYDYMIYHFWIWDIEKFKKNPDE